MKKWKNFHPKGEAFPYKFELPILLPDDIEWLIIFDDDNLLFLRYLSDMYNYDMGNHWVLGIPEPAIIDSFWKVKLNLTKYIYINIGSTLLNIKELKQNNFWINYTKNRDLKLEGAPEQTLFKKE